jgi:catalase
LATLRDPFQGPDNIRSQQRNPKNFLIDYSEFARDPVSLPAVRTKARIHNPSTDAWFDFLANVPESQHAGMMLLSDYGTPVSNYFSAYGCHTFKWTNAEGKFVYIKVRTRKERKKQDKTRKKGTRPRPPQTLTAVCTLALPSTVPLATSPRIQAVHL